MGRIFLALLVGFVGALIVHIGVIFAMPRVAEDNSWARLTRIMEPFRPTLVATGPAASPAGAGLAPPAPGAASAPLSVADGHFGFLDPSFVVVACRFSLANGPVRLSAEEGSGFWSASINARSGDNVYSINERLAPEARLDLLVGTQEQLESVRIEGLLDNEDAIFVTVSTSDFYMTLRALVESESLRPATDRFVRSLSCRSLGLPNGAAPPLAGE